MRFVALLLVGLTFLVSTAEAGKKKRKKKDDLIVVVVLDRSGSMQGVKLEAAKETVRAIREVLPRKAELGVVTYDSEATVVVDRVRAGNKKTILPAIDGIQAGGGTNILPGLQAADQMLQASKKKRRLILLVSDGEAPYDGIADTAAIIAEHGATISAIGVSDADRNLLSLIVEAGAGRLYMVEDVGELPRIGMKEVEALSGK